MNQGLENDMARSIDRPHNEQTAMFEDQHEHLASVPVFVRRSLIYLGYSALFILFAVSIGIFGYHWIAGFDWVDSFLNAAMILGGMGPINALPTESAKIFAGMYALFCGLVFVLAMGVLLAPLVHRLLHRLHLDGNDG
jgi:hypothetical protein